MKQIYIKNVIILGHLMDTPLFINLHRVLLCPLLGQLVVLVPGRQERYYLMDQVIVNSPVSLEDPGNFCDKRIWRILVISLAN